MMSGSSNEADVSIYACLVTEDDRNDWYKISSRDEGKWINIPGDVDLDSERVRESYTPDHCLTPVDRIYLSSSGYSSVVLNSMIYLIGGEEETSSRPHAVAPPRIARCPSSTVMVYDTRRSGSRWRRGTPMIGGKATPISIVADGKIYVFSSYPAGILPDEPSAEVYDPLDDVWLQLPYPPPSLFSECCGYSMVYCLHYNEKTKDIVFQCYNDGVWKFNISSYGWECVSSKPWGLPCDHAQLFAPLRSVARVVVEDVVYIWGQKELHAYDLQGMRNISIRNLQMLHVLTESFDPHFSRSYMFHLGNTTLLLVWCVRGFPDCQRICCLTFSSRCSMGEEIGVDLEYHQYSTFLTKGSYLINCVALTPANCQDVATHSGSVQVKGMTLKRYRKARQPIYTRAQLTRHARRVFIGNLPLDIVNLLSPTNSPFVEFLIAVYNEMLTMTEVPNLCQASILACHFSKERSFAILELDSIEATNNFMALDGIMCEGTALRIRRPSDYNPGLAARLGPTQPSCHLSLRGLDFEKIENDDNVNILRRSMQALAWQASAPYIYGLDTTLSTVICLFEAICSNGVSIAERNWSTKEFLESKGKKYGRVDVFTPKENRREKNPAVGRVFLKYNTIENASSAMKGIIHDPELRGSLAFYYPEHEYENKNFDYLSNYTSLKCSLKRVLCGCKEWYSGFCYI